MMPHKGKRVLFDTNLVMDIATEREGWETSFVAYDIAVVCGMEPCLTVSATTDVAYLLTSSTYKLTPAKATAALRNLFRMFTLLDVCSSDAHAALACDMTDYEDALLSFAAERHGCVLIISRNVKDFVAASLLCLSPEDFIKTYRPKNYDYEFVSFGHETFFMVL